LKFTSGLICYVFSWDWCEKTPKYRLNIFGRPTGGTPNSQERTGGGPLVIFVGGASDSVQAQSTGEKEKSSALHLLH
jgi:hypothetical protein